MESRSLYSVEYKLILLATDLPGFAIVFPDNMPRSIEYYVLKLCGCCKKDQYGFNHLMLAFLPEWIEASYF